MEETSPPEFGNDPSDTVEPNRVATGDGDELSRVTRERDGYLDQLLRARAEFANYQKRMRAQADSDRAYAVAGLAADLLSPLDNLERAIEVARTADAEALVDGLTLVHKQWLEAFARHGVEPIDALNYPFDPHLHEAIAQRPAPGQPEGIVIAEVARGYRVGDRILRPSRVVVSAGQ